MITAAVIGLAAMTMASGPAVAGPDGEGEGMEGAITRVDAGYGRLETCRAEGPGRAAAKGADTWACSAYKDYYRLYLTWYT